MLYLAFKRPRLDQLGKASQRCWVSPPHDVPSLGLYIVASFGDRGRLAFNLVMGHVDSVYALFYTEWGSHHISTISILLFVATSFISDSISMRVGGTRGSNLLPSYI